MRLLIAALITSSVLTVIAPAQATLNVPGSFATIQAAVTAAA